MRIITNHQHEQRQAELAENHRLINELLAANARLAEQVTDLRDDAIRAEKALRNTTAAERTVHREDSELQRQLADLHERLELLQAQTEAMDMPIGLDGITPEDWRDAVIVVVANIADQRKTAATLSEARA